MDVRASIRKASFSLGGHLVLYEVFLGIPAALVFLALNASDGTLTLLWALWCILISGIAAAVMATLFWFVVSRRLIQMRMRSLSK